MLNPIESTMTLYDAQLHASKELINAFLSSVQRIDRAVLQTAKEELNSQLAYAQALTVATDPRGAAILRQSFETPNREHTLACYREIFDAMSEQGQSGRRASRDVLFSSVGDRSGSTAAERH